MRVRWWMSLVLAAGLVAGCGSSGGDDNAGGTTQTTGDAAVDPRDIDLCAVIDLATVQALTGESERFVSQRSGGRCFWGGAKPGVQSYVELSLARQPGGLDALTYEVGDCRVTSISGLGEEAEGGTCTPSPQQKVYVRAFDGELIATVLVNAPRRTLAPADIVATARSVLAAG
jgi:hypothetical protein